MSTPAPSPFSKVIPKLQTAWDSTSLKALMMCPRYYKYTILQGWRASTTDLEFGILAQLGFERYEKGRLAGETKEEAQIEALRLVLEKSGHYEVPTTASPPECVPEPVWVPWGGRYVHKWRCEGTEPYRNPKGNRAKCPYSHKGKWFVTPQPSICGVCGSETEGQRMWDSDNPKKDRYTLARLIVWYIEEQPDDINEGLAPYAFPDGTPAVELSGKLPLPFNACTGEPYIIAVNLDSIKRFGREYFIADHKTTGKSLGRAYFSGFSPDCQIDTYDFVGSILFPELKIKGVIIEAAQCMVGGVRFGIHPCYRSEALREEYLRDLGELLRRAEHYAKRDHWPKETASCWHCVFRDVCSADPARRQALLEDNFENRKWNPLEER